MKNIWFIFIGMLAVFALFFVMFTDWSFNSLLKNTIPKKVAAQVSTNIKVPKHIDTVPNTSPNTHKKPSLIKEIMQPESQEKALPEDEQIYKEEIAEVSTKEIKVKSIQKSIIKTTTLSIDRATKVKMKIKAKEKDGIVKARVSIIHNMLTYAQATKKNQEANFITHITGLVGSRVIYDASTSQFLSKNPLLKFSFKGQKGETLTIIYQQLKGELFYASKKIR